MNSSSSLPAMAGQAIPILLNVVAAFVGAFGQHFYKKGAARLGEGVLLKNFELWLGALLFCGVMVLFVAAYRLGGKLSVVYPFYATTFLWSSLIALYVVGEKMSLWQWVGVAFVILGTAMVAAFQSVT